MAVERDTTSSNTRSLASAVTDYLNYLTTEKGLTENTLFHYGHDLALFTRFIERIERKKAREIPVTVVNSRSIEAFLDDQTHRRNNQVSSNRRRLACLRGLVRFLTLLGALPGESNPSVDLPNKSTRPPTFLRPPEQRALLDAARTAAPNPVRDYAIFLLFLHCGCRLSEVLRLEPADIDLRKGVVRISNGDDTERVVPLTLEAHRAVAAYMARRPKGTAPQLFLNRAHQPITKGAIYHAFNRCLSVAGIRRPRISIQSLRNTYIKGLIDHGYPRHRIQELSGNRSPAALNPYLKLSEARERTRQYGTGEQKGPRPQRPPTEE